MNSLLVSVSCNNSCRLIEIKYFDNLKYEDIHYTVSRECNLPDPVFHTSNGSAITDSLLASYVERFSHYPNFILLASEKNGNNNLSNNTNPTSSPVIVSAFPIQRSQLPKPASNINYTPQENTPQNDFHSKEELLIFLKNNPICCLVLASYQKKHQLSGSDQTKISKCIIQHLLFNHPNRTLARHDFNKVISYIVELFPGETHEIYFKKSSKSLCGKLYDAYNNYRAILAKQGIIVRRSRLQNEDTSTKIHQTDELNNSNSSTVNVKDQESFANLPNINHLHESNDNVNKSIENLMFNNEQFLTNSNEQMNTSNKLLTISKEDLLKFLENNPITKIILKKYEQQRDLQHADKINLSKEIIKYIHQNFNNTFTKKTLQILSKFITQIFPTEKAESYYYELSPDYETSSGLLLDTYNYVQNLPQSLKSSNTFTNNQPVEECLNAVNFQTDQVKIEEFDAPELSPPFPYFDFENINASSNGKLFENVQLSAPSIKRKHLNQATDKRMKQKLSNNIENTSDNMNSSEMLKIFSENLYGMHKKLLNEFYQNQIELSEKEQKYQKNRDDILIKTFCEQTNKIVDCLKSLVQTTNNIQMPSSSSVSTTT